MIKSLPFRRSASAALIASVALFGFTGITAAAEPAAPEAKKACFYAHQIGGWTRVDDHTLRVSAGPSKNYDLTLAVSPPSRLNQESLAIKSDPSGMVCTGNGLGVSVITGGIGINNIPVTKVALAPTKAEEAAAKDKAKTAPADPS